MIGTPPPNRDRFLCAIAERIAPERVQAVFLFPPMRQGPVETGVAVLAVDPPAPVAEVASVAPERESQDTEHAEHAEEGTNTAGDPGVVLEASLPVVSDSASLRPMVLTARYRHTLKGPDRGKWELEILEQADAPLITIETVVRGVQARLDDQAEPERLGADDLRTALVEGVWTTPAR
jgi:hypothetical protein